MIEIYKIITRKYDSKAVPTLKLMGPSSTRRHDLNCFFYQASDSLWVKLGVVVCVIWCSSLGSM